MTDSKEESKETADSEVDKDLVTRLRAESAAVRDCFTQFSFNAIALASAALGIIFSSSEKLEYADFAAIPFIGLLSVVSRIGIYKYSTSNRLLGFELHLYRSVGEKGTKDGWQSHMRNIDWEAALRAWRVVQPAVFRSIYITPEDFSGFKPMRWLLRSVPTLRMLYERTPLVYKLRPETKDDINSYLDTGELRAQKAGYPWFHLPTITRMRNKEGNSSLRLNESGLYHAGSYLRHMLAAFTFLQLLLLAPMILGVFKDWPAARGPSPMPPLFLPRVVVVGVSLVVIMLARMTTSDRREMIESGLLSIHSCAIIWQAVVLAHFRARERRSDYTHYTEALVDEAVAIAENPFDIHEYIRAGKPRNKKPPNTAAQAGSYAAA